jgi:hypothetical protein
LGSGSGHSNADADTGPAVASAPKHNPNPNARGLQYMHIRVETLASFMGKGFIDLRTDSAECLKPNGYATAGSFGK